MTEEVIAAPVVETEVAPVEEAVTSQQEGTADPVDESKPESKPEKTFTQTELDDILKKRLAKESRKVERYARAEAELKLLKEQMTQRQTVTQDRSEPKPEEFKDYESYIEAVTDWKVEQKFKGLEAKTAQERQMQAQAQQEAKIRENLSRAAEKYEDFEEVITNPNVPITLAMRDAIGESEMGGDIAYYLGTNVQEAARIANLSPIGQVKAILAIENDLKAPKKVTTEAPPPITPSGTKATVAKTPDQMSQKEFAEWRKKFIKNR